jgi:hypothetical protein
MDGEALALAATVTLLMLVSCALVTVILGTVILDKEYDFSLIQHIHVLLKLPFDFSNRNEDQGTFGLAMNVSSQK